MCRTARESFLGVHTRFTQTPCKALNGEILSSDKPPKNIPHEVQHAFTIHSIQGETAKHLLFVDARRMFEMQH